MLKKLEEEFIEEVKREIQALGGVVEMDSDNYSFKLHVSPEKLEYAYKIVEELRVYYNIKQVEEILKDPFYRIKLMVKELNTNE